MKRYNVSANRYNGSDGYGHGRPAAGTGAWVRGRRAGTGTTSFFLKKLTGPSQIRTRVPVYPPIPGHRYGYRTQIHGYELDPTGFSKPLIKLY
jgi:hypothetical protein